jgi:ATP-binding cassette subfamily B multidrug efflux pump
MSESEIARIKRKKAVQSIMGYLAKYRRRLVIGGICLVLTHSLLLITPWILKLTIDALKTGITRERLLLLACLFAGVTAVSGIFRFLMRRIIIGVSRKIELDIRGDFFSHLEAMSARFYNRHRTGDLMALATNDLNAVRALVGPGVMYSMNTAFVGGVAVTLMAVLSWKLTILSLLPMIFLTLVVYHSIKVIHRLFEAVQRRFGELNSAAQENLSGIRVVKAYARENSELEKFRQTSLKYVTENMKLFKVQSLLHPLLSTVAGIGVLLILGVGGKDVIDGRLSLGSFVAFNGYLALMIWPMIAIGWVMNITQRGLASMERVNAVLEVPADIQDEPEIVESSPALQDDSIQFDNVSFGYESEAGRKQVLDRLSFKINSGETVAVVGPTGSGKTTLVSLILRLIEPTEGEVRIGGMPIQRIPLEHLRRIMGLVPQDIFLFSDTIKENISFGVSGLDEDELGRLSRIACLEEEILSFPSKYSSFVGERGINLSGGQKQRLAIARALAMEPRVLILDDALSSVDTNTEEKILAELRGLMKKRTSILISHRISTVRLADRIFVLEAGRIIESGSHEEMVKRNGVYTQMYRKQQLESELKES